MMMTRSARRRPIQLTIQAFSWLLKFPTGGRGPPLDLDRETGWDARLGRNRTRSREAPPSRLGFPTRIRTRTHGRPRPAGAPERRAPMRRARQRPLLSESAGNRGSTSSSRSLLGSRTLLIAPATRRIGASAVYWRGFRADFVDDATDLGSQAALRRLCSPDLGS